MSVHHDDIGLQTVLCHQKVCCKSDLMIYRLYFCCLDDATDDEARERSSEKVQILRDASGCISVILLLASGGGAVFFINCTSSYILF